jgi:GntR family transcriptional regulator
MTPQWRDDQPIWRQIKERMLSAILDGTLKEGDPLPSVRQIAVDFSVNPLTVSKAYQELADDNVVERRRGLGMFIGTGAREALLFQERAAFLANEWPATIMRIRQLGFSPGELLKNIDGGVE